MNQDLAKPTRIICCCFLWKKKPKRKPTLNAMLSKVQFTFKMNSIDSLQGIEYLYIICNSLLLNDGDLVNLDQTILII
jgi:hypothetical protein